MRQRDLAGQTTSATVIFTLGVKQSGEELASAKTNNPVQAFTNKKLDSHFTRERRGVAIFAKACFGHPSPSKLQKLRDRYCLRRPSRPAPGVDYPTRGSQLRAQ
ncbi:MAG: hypothetical protein LUQ57_01335 [Methylococcaceae bacterium]|nr:hypothetical protein [Methylococcaceae bacterium]